MNKRIGVATLAVAAVVAFGGCSSGSGGATKSANKGCKTVIGTKVTVVTKDYDFDPDCLELSGASLTVTYDNNDVGIPHDFHLKGAKSASGAESTKVEPGKNGQTITYVDLAPGTYTYVCDIHTNMVGHLTVKK